MSETNAMGPYRVTHTETDSKHGPWDIAPLAFGYDDRDEAVYACEIANAAFAAGRASAQADLDVAREALGELISGLMMDHPMFAIGLNDWKPVVRARAALAKLEGRG